MKREGSLEKGEEGGKIWLCKVVGEKKEEGYKKENSRNRTSDDLVV